MKKSKFDLSHERKMSLNMGELIPIMVQDILPGDSFRVNTEILLRFAPLLAPIMHRVNVFTHFFFVPNRLVWSEWEDFITGGRDGDLEPAVPFVNFPDSLVGNDKYVNGSLCDYMGLPTYAAIPGAPNSVQVQVLPFRAYQLIYNEYFRDQNLSDPVAITTDSGQLTTAEATEVLTKRKRAWEKDYFTSALPFAQRGPAAGAPVEFVDGQASRAYAAGAGNLLPNQTGFTTDANGNIQGTPGGLARIETDQTVLIEEIRKAWSLQKWLERNARRGARYVEQLLAHFDVISDDARLQRPEYLGGGRTPVVISEVLSTFQADPTVAPYPQGNMSGHGISVGAANGFRKTFKEHGYVIGIMSVIPKTSYQQGIPKHYRRFDKFEYPWPEFANLGEQQVMSDELYFDINAPYPTPPVGFGYQERYAEAKFAPSTTHGEFRDSLAFWHMGRIFSSQPVLNEDFVMSDPTTRIFAVEDPAEHHLLCQLWNSVSAIRPLPFYGIPR